MLSAHDQNTERHRADCGQLSRTCASDCLRCVCGWSSNRRWSWDHVGRTTHDLRSVSLLVPPQSGLIISTTWKACMWVMAGMAAIVVVSAYFVFPTDFLTTTDRRVDWIGAALVTVGLIFIQFSVSAGETAPQGWATWCECSDVCLATTDPIDIIMLLILGVLLVACFFFWENHVTTKTSRPPLMSPALWTRAHGRLAAVYMIGFVSWMGFVVSAIYSVSSR